MNSFAIGFIGECMVEVSGNIPAPLKLGFAGDTFNTAAYLSRLLKESGKIEYLTGLGSDMLSTRMREFLEASGVATRHIRTIPNKSPGLYLIETGNNGERTFHYWRGEAAAKFFLDDLTPETFAESCLKAFNAVYLSGISIAILTEQGRKTLYEALLIARKSGLKIYFDTNFRPLLWKSREQARTFFAQFISIADVALVTDTDLADLYEIGLTQTEEVLRKFEVPEAVLKSGEHPCIVFSGQDRISVPACKVDMVVDTTAAGDSFNAGYLAARLKGCSPKQAAICGHQLASRVIQQHGAIISSDSMPELDFKTDDTSTSA